MYTLSKNIYDFKEEVFLIGTTLSTFVIAQGKTDIQNSALLIHDLGDQFPILLLDVCDGDVHL